MRATNPAVIQQSISATVNKNDLAPFEDLLAVLATLVAARSDALHGCGHLRSCEELLVSLLGCRRRLRDAAQRAFGTSTPCTRWVHEQR